MVSRRGQSRNFREQNLFSEGKLLPQAKIRQGIICVLKLLIGLEFLENYKYYWKNLVSISSMRQNESNSEPVELIIITHEAMEKMSGTLLEIDKRADIIKGKSIMIRLGDIS